NHLLTCSGFVKTSKTSAIGASNSRVMTLSRSFGKSTIADPWRLGVTAALLVLFLQLFEVVIHPVQAFVPSLLVLGQPLVKRPKARRFPAVQAGERGRP